jgi:hypothetical protein
MLFLFGGVLMGLAPGAMPGVRGPGRACHSTAIYFRYGPVRGIAVLLGWSVVRPPRHALSVCSTHVLAQGVFPQAEQLILRKVESFV